MTTKLLFSELPIGCDFMWTNHSKVHHAHRYLKVARWAYKALYATDGRISSLPTNRPVWSTEDPLRLAVLLAREHDAYRKAVLRGYPKPLQP